MDRIEREKKTIRQMMYLYCRHSVKDGGLCEECTRLLAYAHQRLDACKYGSGKSACKECRTHCYASAYRAEIREVMRCAGPDLHDYIGKPVPEAVIDEIIGAKSSFAIQSRAFEREQDDIFMALPYIQVIANRISS